MSTQKPTSGKDRLSEELGVDVENLEAQLRLRRDLSRVHGGTPTEMGYIKITRQERNRQDLWMGEFYGLLAVSSTS